MCCFGCRLGIYVEFDYMGFVGFVNLIPDLFIYLLFIIFFFLFMMDSHCWVVYLACAVLCITCS